jgi:hypothetical protein
MKNGWKPWSDQEKIKLISLVQQGLSQKQIAEKMQGRSLSAIANRIYNDSEILSAYRQSSSRRRPAKRVVVKKPAPVVAPIQPKVEVRTRSADMRWVLVTSSVSAVMSLTTLLVVVAAVLS